MWTIRIRFYFPYAASCQWQGILIGADPSVYGKQGYFDFSMGACRSSAWVCDLHHQTAKARNYPPAEGNSRRFQKQDFD